MSVQDGVGAVTLAGIAIVAAGFLFVIVNASRTGDAAQVQGRAYAIRRWWFYFLVVLGVVVTWVTLRPFPIADQHTEAPGAQVVDAVASQWSWQLSSQRVTAGTPVEFRVTSEDVNHGFAIYGPDERIVTQTQAMPTVTNRLVHTFTTPGKYHVMCLEYCGLAHHAMMAEIEVVAATEAQP